MEEQCHTESEEMIKRIYQLMHELELYPDTNGCVCCGRNIHECFFGELGTCEHGRVLLCTNLGCLTNYINTLTNLMVNRLSYEDNERKRAYIMLLPNDILRGILCSMLDDSDFNINGFINTFVDKKLAFNNYSDEEKKKIICCMTDEELSQILQNIINHPIFDITSFCENYLE